MDDAAALKQSNQVTAAARPFAVREDRKYDNGVRLKVKYTYTHAWTTESEIGDNCNVKSSTVVSKLNDYFNDQVDSGTTLNIELDHSSLSLSVQGSVEASSGLLQGQAQTFLGPIRIFDTEDVLKDVDPRDIVRTKGVLLKPTGVTMSSSVAEDATTKPANCVDKDTIKGDCKSTAEKNPWVQLDFGNAEPVTRVVLHVADNLRDSGNGRKSMRPACDVPRVVGRQIVRHPGPRRRQALLRQRRRLP